MMILCSSCFVFKDDCDQSRLLLLSLYGTCTVLECLLTMFNVVSVSQYFGGGGKFLHVTCSLKTSYNIR